MAGRDWAENVTTISDNLKTKYDTLCDIKRHDILRQIHDKSGQFVTYLPPFVRRAIPSRLMTEQFWV